ncbi:hypothetical protein [Sphaerisporangium album]|uniref:hypothetical protein n=1 Tax=Sphaerisporangium album TaxID=509200 RepID=UPI0011C04399|nr:hypothetical protein [Sphaerisporangium album]
MTYPAESRVVFASWTPPDVTTLVKMYWVCEQGHDGIDYPGMRTVCDGCKRAIVVPTSPTSTDVHEVSDGVDALDARRERDRAEAAIKLAEHMLSKFTEEGVHNGVTSYPAGGSARAESRTGGGRSSRR